MPTNFGSTKRLVPRLAGAFIAVVGILLKVEQLYLMAAILFLIPVVSYWMGRAMMVGLECRRTVPVSCNEGERVLVSLRLDNLGWFPKFCLRAVDGLPPWLRLAGHESPVILVLATGENSRITYYVEAEKRGLYLLGPLQVHSSDPLGFAAFTRAFPIVDELLVYPTALSLRRPFLEGASLRGWMGQESGAMRGSGIDFHGIREYQYGDELRRVHWRTTARTGKLVVAEYAQGNALDAVIALDLYKQSYTNTGEGTESALEYAIKIAATICLNLLDNGHRVRLLTESTLHEIPAVGSQEALRVYFLETLARAEATSALTLGELLAQGAEYILPGTTLVGISTDAAGPGLTAGLAQYEAQGTRSFGFLMDSASFRNVASPAVLGIAGASSFGGNQIQPVRRGDNLVQVIEEISNVRN